jgi:integrase
VTKRNPKNERIKHRYMAYLEKAKQMAPSSAEAAAAAITQFEATTGYKDFAAFHIEQAARFKRVLEDERHHRTGKPLAKATIHSRLLAVKAFFVWLAGYPGYKSKITYSDCEYFNPPAKDARIASAQREKPVPTLEQIRHALATMPNSTFIEKRDRALIAFALLSGARDDAIASLQLGQVDPLRRCIDQDARTVRTKFSKTMLTSFFPVGDDIEGIVTDWLNCLRTECLFSDTDPLFPATLRGLNEKGEFAALGLSRDFWTTADPIRKAFKTAFAAAGLPYFNPHSFRSTLAQLGLRLCDTPEQLKAWSQNLGHEDMLTTLTSYGKLDGHRQRELLNRLAVGPDAGSREDGKPTPEEVGRVLAFLQAQQ